MRIFKNTTKFPIVFDTAKGKIVVMPDQEIHLEESGNIPQEVLKEESKNVLQGSTDTNIESDLKKRFGKRFGKKQ